jgi:hypothetical protein
MGNTKIRNNEEMMGHLWIKFGVWSLRHTCKQNQVYSGNDFPTQAECGNTVSNKACGFLDEGKNTENELMGR